MILKTIDAHTAGEPLRLIVDGFPPLEGRTILEKREYIREHHDHLRRALMLEPRGHADMYGALLTGPERPGSDAGVLFMHNQGYSTMCGHGIIAVVTIGLERGLFAGRPDGDDEEVVLDSPAGVIRARATWTGGGAPLDGAPRAARREAPPYGGARRAAGHEAPPYRVTRVRFTNVPSFVLHAGVPVRLGARELRADVAFGGAFYAIVDSEAAGIPIVPERLGDLRQAGMAIKDAVERAVTVGHPAEPELHGLYGTIFTGPPASEEADLRNVTIFADAEVDRSPCGTGTCAVMAVLAAMGLLGPEQTFTHESIIGTRFRGRIVGEASLSHRLRQASGESAEALRAKAETPNSQTPNSPTPALHAILPEIEGEAFITGESTFILDETDPLRYGFRL